MTSSSCGNAARRPNFAIACSWLPHTCMIDTGERPSERVWAASASSSAIARAGSRNFMRAKSFTGDCLELAAHVGGHQVGFAGALEQLVVHRERLADVLGGD